MPSKLDWYGDQIKEAVEKATMAAMDETMGYCVQSAMSLVHVKYGILRGSLRFEPAERDSDGDIVGRWGSFNVNYALVQEILPPPRGKPYLRPSADIEYPKLGKRIKDQL